MRSTSFSSAPSPAFLRPVCLSLVVVVDYLFFRRTIGWTLGGLGLSLIGLAFWRFERLRGDRHAIVLGALSALPMLAMFEEPGWLLGILGALGLTTLALTGAYGWTPEGPTWILRWVQFATLGWYRSLESLRTVGRDRGPGGGKFVGWLLPLVMSLAFLLLFSAANPVIEHAIARALNAIDPARVLFWIFSAAACWHWLVARIGAPFAGLLRGGVPTVMTPDAVTGVLRTLVCSNLLFAIHLALDVIYLPGGTRLPDGMTCAHYAHRGAYPLIVAALLAAGFILAAFRPGRSTTRSARALALLWVAQTVLLTLASIWRLWLYVESYSLTRWRFATAVWIGLVAIGLVCIGVRILVGKNNTWLINANLVALLLVLFVVGAADVDGFIASYNVRHCREVCGKGSVLDARYLLHLGPDALPAILWMESQLALRAGDGSRRFTAEQIDRLEQERRRRLADWRGWTWRRQRAEKLHPAPPHEAGWGRDVFGSVH